jgi:CubicO group peptidase (beta-lactamase class C family)
MRRPLALLAFALALSSACSGPPAGNGKEEIETKEEGITLAWSNLIYYFDYTGSSLDSAANTNKTNGFRPISISAYGTTTAPRFAAVFIKDGGPDWKFKRGTGTGSFSTEFSKQAGLGYKPALLSFDGSADKVVWGAVFVATPDPIPFTRHLLVSGKMTDSGTIQFWLKKAREEKLIPSTLSIYGTAAAPQYAIVLEPNTANVEWTVGVIDVGGRPNPPPLPVVGGVPLPPVIGVNGVNDTVAEYQQRWNAQVSAGNRPSLIDLNDSNHYIELFRDDSLGALVGRHDLTSQGLKDEIMKQGDAGLFPITIAAGGAGTGARFAALFAPRDRPATRAFTVRGSSAATDTTIATVDTVMRDFMKRNNVHQATLAAVQNRKLAYARGYTWAEPGYKITTPTTFFRLASVSKMVTAMEMMRVMQRSGGTINANTTVQSLLNLTKPDKSAPDARFSTITLGNLLAHNYPTLTDAMGNQMCLLRDASVDLDASPDMKTLPVTTLRSVQVALTRSDLIVPFTVNNSCYSNFAYVLLSMVIDQQRTSYLNGVQTDLMAPLGITRFRVANPDIATQAADEALYRSFGLHTRGSVNVTGTPLGATPYGESNFNVTIGAGGLSMAATDVARLLAMLNMRFNNNPVYTNQATAAITAMVGSSPPLGFDQAPSDATGTHVVKGGELNGLQSTVYYTQDNLSYVLMWSRNEVPNSGNGSDDWWPLWPALETALNGANLASRTDLFPTYGMPSLPADPPCAPGLSSCIQFDSSQFCADLTKDTFNCGACGISCSIGQVCKAGACVAGKTCAINETVCTRLDGNQYCANLQSSQSDCGGCFNRCPSVDFCQMGMCSGGVTCSGETKLLCPLPGGSEACVEPSTDVNNCGGCGSVCAGGQTCVAGKCTGGSTAAPSNLSASIAGGDTVTLTWTDNSSNESGFRIERKVGTGAFATLATKGTNVTSHADGSLSANTYSYRVIATGATDSAPSNSAVVVIRIPAADAHVRNGNATSNFGGNPAWDVKCAFAAGSTRQAFIRFSLTDVAATVSSAKIRLYGNSVTSSKQVAISGVSDTTWVEGTGTVAAPTTTGITWNTKPGIGAQLTSKSVTTAAGWWEFDVTAYVKAQKTAGATSVSFAVTNLTQSDEGPTVFNTKENGSSKPLLVVSSR